MEEGSDSKTVVEHESANMKQNTKKVIIFGATGQSGRQLLQQALDVGYKVVAVARTPEKLDEFKK